MTKIPILIYTDAPDHATGLARICRDLAWLLHHDPDTSELFRVGTLGVWGKGSARFPWMQYCASGPDDATMKMPDIATDFFQGQPGILFTITPPTWLFDVVMPEFRARSDSNWLRVDEWYSKRQFKVWSYVAVETHGTLGRFPLLTKEILSRIDRKVYYNAWGASLAINSGLADPDGKARFIHHGIDTSKFKRCSPAEALDVRNMWELQPNDLLIGCVATNTRRKQLSMLLEAFYLLKHQVGSVKTRLWLHTDKFVGGECNIPALCTDLGLRDPEDVITTSSLKGYSDEWLAQMYSACDVMTLPTGGEGFGYPVVEALACGTPCVTSTFGAQAEFYTDWVHSGWLVPPVAQHLFGAHNLVEPIHDPQVWAMRILSAWTEAKNRGIDLQLECMVQAKRWDWQLQWQAWKRWFVDGHAQFLDNPVEEETTDGKGQVVHNPLVDRAGA